MTGHVATDGSLLGTAGKWGACGWAVVQLDYDEELGHTSCGRFLGWNNLRAGAEKEKQEATQGQWQMESPFKEVLEQIKKHSDLSCNAYMMRRAYYVKKAGSFKEAFRDR